MIHSRAPAAIWLHAEHPFSHLGTSRTFEAWLLVRLLGFHALQAQSGGSGSTQDLDSAQQVAAPSRGEHESKDLDESPGAYSSARRPDMDLGRTKTTVLGSSSFVLRAIANHYDLKQAHHNSRRNQSQTAPI